MKDFSKDTFDPIKILSSVLPNDLTIAKDDDYILIKNSKGEECKVIFPKNEVEAEINTIKRYGKYLTVGDTNLLCILTCERKLLSEELVLQGNIKGKITSDFEGYYGIISLNFDKNIIDWSKIKFGEETRLSNILIDNIILCEITNYNQEYDIRALINSILFYVIYNSGIAIENPYEKFEYLIDRRINGNTIETSYIKNSDLTCFFILGETLKIPHLKYLEYYHVLEYHFLITNINNAKNMVKELLAQALAKNKKIEEHELYNVGRTFAGIYLMKDDFDEENQLLNVVNGEIGFNTILEIIKEQSEDNLRILGKEIFSEKKSKVDITGIYNFDKKQYTDPVSQDEARKFCDAIARRIYRIRNYIVHSKKGEKPELFVPNRKNWEDLSFDIFLIRRMAFALIAKSSFGNILN